MDKDRIGELRKIFVLKTISEEGSLRQSARKLGITPSAVSQTISSLEKSMGQSLMIRHHNKVELTPQGRTLIGAAENIFLEFDSLMGNMKEFKMARLDLGIYESLALDFGPGLIKKLRQDHPNIKINLIMGRSNKLLSKMRSGEICTAIFIPPDYCEGLSLKELFKDRFGLFVSREIYEKKESSMSKLPFAILSPPGPGHPNHLTKVIKEMNKHSRSFLSSDSLEFLRRLCLSGESISLLPLKVVKNYQDQLIEVSDSYLSSEILKSTEHSIALGYMDKCEESEARYLGQIIESLI